METLSFVEIMFFSSVHKSEEIDIFQFFSHE